MGYGRAAAAKRRARSADASDRDGGLSGWSVDEAVEEEDEEVMRRKEQQRALELNRANAAAAAMRFQKEAEARRAAMTRPIMRRQASHKLEQQRAAPGARGAV